MEHLESIRKLAMALAFGYAALTVSMMDQDKGMADKEPTATVKAKAASHDQPGPSARKARSGRKTPKAVTA